MANLIRFDSNAHWYGREGQAKHDADLRVARKEGLYPSVTTIDKDVFKNDFLDKWKLNQLVIAAGESPRQPHENAQQYAQRIYEMSMEKAVTAAEFGKKIHDACEHYPTVPSDAALMPWFSKFEAWYRATLSHMVYSEKVLLDHDLGIAGRTDGKFLTKEGRETVCDWKTQDVKVDDKGRKKPVFYDAWPRQLAFYAVADAKASGVFPQIPACISLIIDSNPNGEVYEKLWSPDEIVSAYRTFVAGAWLWFDKRAYWPVGCWAPSFLTECQTVPMPLP